MDDEPAGRHAAQQVGVAEAELPRLSTGEDLTLGGGERHESSIRVVHGRRLAQGYYRVSLGGPPPNWSHDIAPSAVWRDHFAMWSGSGAGRVAQPVSTRMASAGRLAVTGSPGAGTGRPSLAMTTCRLPPSGSVMSSWLSAPT